VQIHLCKGLVRRFTSSPALLTDDHTETTIGHIDEIQEIITNQLSRLKLEE
jgi:hypothetical protein